MNQEAVIRLVADVLRSKAREASEQKQARLKEGVTDSNVGGYWNSIGDASGRYSAYSDAASIIEGILKK